MKLFVLDTNILLTYLRGDKIYQFVNETYQPFQSGNQSFISVVSLGEIEALALKNDWGLKRKVRLEKAFIEFVPISINAKDIIQRYAEIDAYSQGKLKNKPLPNGMTARNMGKNDIWIAATASVLNIPLISTDKDFLHLYNIFLQFIFVDIQQINAI